MLEKRSELEAVRALRDSNLKEASERARELVAKNPADESAAQLLKETVERFVREEPHAPVEMPDDAPNVAEARRLIASGHLEPAELLLREHLKTAQHDAAAMHLMSEIAARCDLFEDAERILSISAKIHSRSPAARAGIGMTLHRIACEKSRPDYILKAVEALDNALALDPSFEPALEYKAEVFVQTGGFKYAPKAYERLLEVNPHRSLHWVNYGYVLKTLGHFGRGVAAYRTALALDPTNGAAWWSLANLKTAKFFDFDLKTMENVLSGCDLPDASRIDISFALSKALDQHGEYSSAAHWLIEANKLAHETSGSGQNFVGPSLEFVREVYTRAFFDERQGWGDPRMGPIFIVGMRRAGSTLVEQILASHPLVEGTEELLALDRLKDQFAPSAPGQSPVEFLRGLSTRDFAELGDRYLEAVSRSRVSDRPFFTDKNPGNWRYVGLIHCMLPNAKIIDVRRNPMDCCFSNYAQHYAEVDCTYDQHELGAHYSNYVRTMRHFDEVLPGRIHRLIHDDLVEDLEGEVRRLLDYLGLAFDERCLRFYEADRAVYTPSSEQVRRPINREGFGRWRHYEPWLQDLKDGLASVMDNWRK